MCKHRERAGGSSRTAEGWSIPTQRVWGGMQPLGVELASLGQSKLKAICRNKRAEKLGVAKSERGLVLVWLAGVRDLGAFFGPERVASALG